MVFFKTYIPSTTVLPLIEKDYLFAMLQSYLLNKSTTTARRLALRTVNAVDTNNNGTVDDPYFSLHLSKFKWTEKIIIHYVHEARFMSYNNKSRLAHRHPHQQNAK
jgi:hypothetical protein